MSQGRWGAPPHLVDPRRRHDFFADEAVGGGGGPFPRGSGGAAMAAAGGEQWRRPNRRRRCTRAVAETNGAMAVILPRELFGFQGMGCWFSTYWEKGRENRKVS
ncbi:hypothetical protein BRADI_3g04103v3 [Brachypodium distachyon]|uniref:Uncharacterized protein n=1 Tax=Brachypodium distachyon TaxID=15368 RepID=A0A2K2CV50_BRADI|nr:hypothetical protein BRADI_3g04103v3 [Brachypodium distachyon]